MGAIHIQSQVSFLYLPNSIFQSCIRIKIQYSIPGFAVGFFYGDLFMICTDLASLIPPVPFSPKIPAFCLPQARGGSPIQSAPPYVIRSNILHYWTLTYKFLVAAQVKPKNARNMFDPFLLSWSSQEAYQCKYFTQLLQCYIARTFVTMSAIR